MISGKTASGFEFEVNEKLIDSWDFTKLFKQIESKDDAEKLVGTVSLVEMLLGDQEEALTEHLKDEDGFTSTSAMMDEVTEIINIIKDKNTEVKN